jgi:hypothetical protein
LGGASNNDVIHIDKNKNCEAAFAIKEQGRITFGGREAQTLELLTQPRVPCTWCLFKTIESFIQFTNIPGMILADKTRRLTHIDLLIKNTMKESILHIELTKGPSSRHNNGEDKSNSGSLNNRTECILIINAIPLVVPFSDQTSLVFI